MTRPARTTIAADPTARPLRRRLVITAPGCVELIVERLSPVGRHDVRVETVMSGISHGTETAWLTGTAAALHQTWDARRRFYCEGPGREFPIAPGYELIGRVAEIGAAVTGVSLGDLIAVDAPHADAHLVDEATAVAGLIPAGVSPERAVFFVLARVALGAVHDAALSLGETVVVVGLGTLGLLAAQLASLAGAVVIGVDRYPVRVAAAETVGVATVAVAPGVDIAAKVRDLAGPAGADAAIEASGSYSGLHDAIRCLRIGGRVATVASYHGEQSGLRLGEEYHRNRVTLVSSMTVNGCPQRGHPAWTLDRPNRTARRLVAEGVVRTDGLITHRVPFDRAAQAYALITDTPQDTIKVVLTHER